MAGDPLATEDIPTNEWTFIPVEGTSCMNGDSFGFGVNLNPSSDNVVIYFQGGNLCFDLFSCIAVANADGFPPGRLEASAGSLSNGVFSRTAENPMSDWNFVFMPYCSGDLHIGNDPESYRNFAYLGYSNTTKMMQRIIPTFAGAGKVVVTGSSAGAFGALGNFPQIADGFDTVGSEAKLYLLNDAGPPMGDAYLQPCFQSWIRRVFGVDSIPLIDECAACSNAEGGGLGAAPGHIASRHPDVRMAYMSTVADGTIRSFYGYALLGRLQPADEHARRRLPRGARRPPRQPARVPRQREGLPRAGRLPHLPRRAPRLGPVDRGRRLGERLAAPVARRRRGLGPPRALRARHRTATRSPRA